MTNTICLYCKEYLFSSDMYIVEYATKPKGAYKRWKRLGVCCETCYLDDKPTRIEYKQPISFGEVK